MKIKNMALILGASCFAISAMAFQYCPADYCPSPSEVYTQSGLLQFIMPQGGSNDLYGPTPEAFNEAAAKNNWTYDSFVPGSVLSYLKLALVNLPGCQCTYKFEALQTNGGWVGNPGVVTIHYVSPKASSNDFAKGLYP